MDGAAHAIAAEFRRETGLRTGVLASAFRATSSSYKFYWFLALLENLESRDGPIPVSRIIRSMVILAWFSVAQYRLSLGQNDRLQLCVLELQSHARLAGTEPRKRLESALDAWPERDRWTGELARFVPGRFIGAWFPKIARLAPYDLRGARDVAAASVEAWGTADEGPYRLFEHDGIQLIEMSPEWRAWLTSHIGLVRSHAQLHLCRYLQARNPGVPGIVDKLDAPGRRLLTASRIWWRDLIETGGIFATDLYTGRALGPDFDIDHFLPWSFVAHDEPWNLLPTDSAVNRSKGDKIPDMASYLPKLARLHAKIVTTIRLPASMARSYSDFLRMDVGQGGTDPTDAIIERYAERLLPLAQIARSQGFACDWRAGR